MMRIPFRLLILSVIFCFVFVLTGQTQYSNFRTMSLKTESICKEHPSLCSFKSLTKTIGGKDILVLTIGTGERDNKPGIAVFGGVEGSHIVGKELALGFAASLVKESSSPEIKELLDKVTFYVFPDVSPDATEQFFSGIKYERNLNARSTDDDRDFAFDEDPYEDLNKDGQITLIRIEDPTGKFIVSDEDSRVMVEADLARGQTGNYLLYSEGIDNDHDQKFNEDGTGGVNFNRNFTFNYEEFGINAGLHPISENEVKAVVDFLFDKFNIYAVFTFGPQDNLGQPFASDNTPSKDKRITSILKTDEVINTLVSEKYHEITGATGSPLTKKATGNFMEWAYYHYGRYSFSTPAWWFPIEKNKNPEVSFLKYIDKNIINDVFIPWKEITHHDFPGKKVEVGGIKPFAMLNPPPDTLDALINKNFRFIIATALMHPELEFLDIKTENAGENIFRINLKVHNKGIFATCAGIGDLNKWTRIMRISLTPEESQDLLSGQKVQKINRLEGDESAEFSWLISGKGSIKITAGALNTGIITSVINLR